MTIPITKFGKLEKEIRELEEEAVGLPFIVSNFLGKSGGEVTGAIDMTGQPIKNLPDPVDGQDAATKNYIDSSQGHSFFRRLPGRGYAAVKDLDMNENRLLNLGMPTDNREAANKLYTDITANDVKQSLEGHNPFYLNTDKHKARGDIDMLNFKIEGLPMPVEEKDAANKIYVDTLTEDRRRKLEVNNPFNFDNGEYGAKNKIDMKGFKIENVGFPDLPEDVATVGYVDEANVWERKNGGFVAKEHIYLGKKKLGGLREPSANGEAANKKYVDEELKKVTGETLKKGNDGFYSAETNLNLNNFRLFGVPDPTREDEVSNKKYVDEKTANIQPAAGGVDPAELDKIKTDLEKNLAFNTRNQKTFNVKGNINMKQKTIRNVPDPVEVTDVVSKGYVDEMKEFFEDRIKEVEDEAKETKKAVDRVSRLQPGGGAGNGNGADFGDMKGKKLINVGDPENPGDGANRKYVDQKTPFTKTNGYYTTTHGINMDSKKITNLGEPTGEGDASNKKYVDDSINNIETGLIRRNGGFQAIDAIDMNTNRIKNVGAPLVNEDAVNKKYVDNKVILAENQAKIFDEEIVKLKVEDGKRKTETDRVRVLVNEVEEKVEENYEKLESFYKKSDIALLKYLLNTLKNVIVKEGVNEFDGMFFTAPNLKQFLESIEQSFTGTSKTLLERALLKIKEEAGFKDEDIPKEIKKTKDLSDFILLLKEKFKSLDDATKNNEELLKETIHREIFKFKTEKNFLDPAFFKLNGHFLAAGDIDMDQHTIKNLSEPKDENDVVIKKYVDEKTARILPNARIYKFLGTSIILLRAEAKGPIIGTEEILNSNNRQPSPDTPWGFVAFDEYGISIEPTILYFGKFGEEKERYSRLLIPSTFSFIKYAIFFEGLKSETFELDADLKEQHKDRGEQSRTFSFVVSNVENNKMFCEKLVGVSSHSFFNCNTFSLRFKHSHPNVKSFFITFVCILYIPDLDENDFPSILDIY